MKKSTSTEFWIDPKGNLLGLVHQTWIKRTLLLSASPDGPFRSLRQVPLLLEDLKGEASR